MTSSERTLPFKELRDKGDEYDSAFRNRNTYRNAISKLGGIGGFCMAAPMGAIYSEEMLNFPMFASVVAVGAGAAISVAYKEGRESVRIKKVSESIRDKFEIGQADIITTPAGLSLYVQWIYKNANEENCGSPVNDRRVLRYTQQWMDVHGIDTALFDLRGTPDIACGKQQTLEQWFDENKSQNDRFFTIDIDDRPIIELDKQMLSERIDELSIPNVASLDEYIDILRRSGNSRIPELYDQMLNGECSAEQFRSHLRRELEMYIDTTPEVPVIERDSGVYARKRQNSSSYIHGKSITSIAASNGNVSMSITPLDRYYEITDYDAITSQEDPKRQREMALAALWTETVSECDNERPIDTSTVEVQSKRMTLYQEISHDFLESDTFPHSRSVETATKTSVATILCIAGLAAVISGGQTSKVWREEYDSLPPQQQISMTYDEFIAEKSDPIGRARAGVYEKYASIMHKGKRDSGEISGDRLRGSVADQKYDNDVPVAFIESLHGMPKQGYWAKNVNDTVTLHKGLADWTQERFVNELTPVRNDGVKEFQIAYSQEVPMLQVTQLIDRTGDKNGNVALPVRDGTAIIGAAVQYEDTLSQMRPLTVYRSAVNTWSYRAEDVKDIKENDYVIKYWLAQEQNASPWAAAGIKSDDELLVNIPSPLNANPLEKTDVETKIKQQTYSTKPLEKIHDEIRPLNGTDDLDDYVEALSDNDTANCATANTLAVLGQVGKDKLGQPINFTTGYLVKNDEESTLKDAHAWTVDAHQNIHDYTTLLGPEKPDKRPFGKQDFVIGLLALGGLALYKRKSLAQVSRNAHNHALKVNTKINQLSDKLNYRRFESYDPTAQQAAEKVILATFAPEGAAHSARYNTDMLLRNLPDDAAAIEHIDSPREKRGLLRAIRAKKYRQEGLTHNKKTVY